MVKIDVSNCMTAGIFFRYDVNGKLKPDDYFLGKMNEANCNYKIYDKILLTIIKILELSKFKLENIENPIQIIIDHKNIKYFIFSKFLNLRQTRWFAFFWEI